MSEIHIRIGDCVDVLKTLPTGSIARVSCDPPYGISFMSKDWDGKDFVFDHAVWLREVYRVLEPGGKIQAFAATKTYHRLAAAMSSVGFVEIEVEAFGYGSGFPKSQNLSKMIDKFPDALPHVTEIKRFLQQGIEKCPKTKAQINDECGFAACDYARSQGNSPFIRTLPDYTKWLTMKRVIGFGDDMDGKMQPSERSIVGSGRSGSTAFWHENGGLGTYDITSASSKNAKLWEDWGTALKPAWEPIVVGRKPLE